MTDIAKTTQPKATRARKPAAAKTTQPKATRARKPKAGAVVARALDPFRRDLLSGASTNAMAFAIG